MCRILEVACGMSFPARAATDSMSQEFIAYRPRLEQYWRGIILFGRNVASYKFALAKALLELRPSAGQVVKLEELALPFSTQIREHLRTADKQATSAGSRFLDACRRANAGELSDTELLDQTVRLGFNNVIDAFHVVSGADVPKRFFLDERQGGGGIRITEEFAELLGGTQAANLGPETEARWRLVETAWDLRLSRSLLTVNHDPETESLFVHDRKLRRRSVTGAREALSGYQKGLCFYCFAPMALSSLEKPDVDHFVPHVLKGFALGAQLDGVWNLCLTCLACNRGVGGKFDRVPSRPLLDRLRRRNEFLIDSHHPLRDTLIAQTGQTRAARWRFLEQAHATALEFLIHTWTPPPVDDPPF